MTLSKKPRLMRVVLVLSLLAVCVLYIAEAFSALVNAGVTADSTVNLSMRQIESGNDYTCGIASSGKAYCWGSNYYGQLGNGTNTNSLVPVPVDTSGVLSGKTILSISAGFRHVCVIASDNQAYCWGAGYSGGLGNNLNWDMNYPVAVNTAGVLSGKTVKSISAGQDHTCAVASDNLAYCWGYNGYGALGDNSTTTAYVPVAVSTAGLLSGKTVVSIVSATYYSCAIASNGLAYCWGYNNQGQLGDNSTTTAYVPVAVYTSGALLNKTVLSISASSLSSDAHTCAVASDNQAYCWGRNYYGELGNNSTTDSSVPVAVYTAGLLSGKTILSVSAGGIWSCAIASDNNAYCWGYNGSGELGNNSTTHSSVPVAVYTAGLLSGKTLRSVDSYGASCAIASDNLAYCWGYNGSGELGNNSTSNSSIPVAVALIPQSVAVTLDQAVYRSYDSSSTAVPGSSLASTNTAATLPSIAQSFRVRIGATVGQSVDDPIVQQLATGDYSGCNIVEDKAYCWGQNTNGTLGNNSTTGSSIPVAVDTSGVLSGKTVRHIIAGWMHTCAVASDNKAYCWGYNSAGQVGDNSSTNRTAPVAVNTAGVLSGKNITSIATGDEHTCAVASDNLAYCWGSNGNGRLGNNSTTPSLVPVAVYTSGALLNKTIKSIATGSYHTCAIASNGLAYCWGINTNGQLGDNTVTQRIVPTAVYTAGALSGKTMKAISTSGIHTCAIASDNLAYCWGYNGQGQLGNNSTTQSRVPAAVNTAGVLSGKTIKSIATGYSHTCVVASDNQAYCWGDNADGELGNNSTTQSLVPVAVNTAGVLSGKTIKSIAVSYAHTCVIASDNQTYCWGEGANGELGNGSNTQSTVPVAVNKSPFVNSNATTIVASSLKLRLQYALKASAPTCNSVSSGWSDVTNSSLISYDDVSPDDGLTISSIGSGDPSLPPGSSGYNYQTTVRGISATPYTFVNSSTLAASQTALWDFVLRDRTSSSNTSYCLRMITDTSSSPGSSVDTYSQYPELTTASGDLGIRFTDSGSSTLTDPTTTFSDSSYHDSTQTTTATLSNNSSQQIEISNSASSTGWSISMAATDGPSSTWERSDLGASYPYNSASSSNGQLSIDMGASTFTATGTTPSGSACSATGLSTGSNQSFQSGVIDAITLASASSSSDFNCSFKLQNIGLNQTIPQYQLPGTYSMKVTVTVVAQ